MLEAILDYESGGYTKPDKPLNAFDTINKFKANGTVCPERCDQLIAICKSYGLDSSYSVHDDLVGMEYCNAYQHVTEEMIAADIVNYFKYDL
jgi:hypothetical protein